MGEDALTTNPTLAYQNNGSAATPDNTTAGTYDIVPSGASAGDNYNISYTNGTLTISEKPTATVKKAPTAKTLTYNGSAQELVTAGEATGGEMQYALGNATEATQPYTTSIPSKTDAGTYYVWYKAVGDKDHSDSESKCVTSKIRAAISKKVTFKVVNGSWNDGKKDDVTVNLRSYEGDTLKLSANQIPAVGNKPDNNYKAGSWNVKPAAGTAITKDTTYTYTYVKKASAKTKPAPAAKKKKTASKKVNRILSLKGTQTGSKITTTWTRIPDASMYKVYGAYCGKKMKLLKTIKRNTTTKATFTKLNGKKLNLKKNYKFQVIAYKKSMVK